VAAQKKGGAIRWCIDYILLNKVTLHDSISLPGIEDNLARLSGSSVFSGFDGAAQACIIALGYIKSMDLKLPSLLLLACGNSNVYRLGCVMHRQHIPI
jgi:hypothetical protein